MHVIEAGISILFGASSIDTKDVPFPSLEIGVIASSGLDRGSDNKILASTSRKLCRIYVINRKVRGERDARKGSVPAKRTRLMGKEKKEKTSLSGYLTLPLSPSLA